MEDFKYGDRVFAKVRGFCPWPARIDGSSENQGRTLFNVFFYGTYEVALLTSKDLFPYEENKELFMSGKPKRYDDFKKGLLEIVNCPNKGLSDKTLTPAESSKPVAVESKKEENEGQMKTAEQKDEPENVSMLENAPNQEMARFLMEKLSHAIPLLRRQIELNYLITSNLNDKLIRHNLTAVIEALDELDTLSLDPLLLPKHPLLETISTLKQYSGPEENPEHSAEERAFLMEQAGIIRNKASLFDERLKMLLGKAKKFEVKERITVEAGNTEELSTP